MFQDGTSSLFKDSVNPSKAFTGQTGSWNSEKQPETPTEFSRGVESKARRRVVSTSGADVEDVLALVGGAVLSEKLDGLGTMSVITGRHRSANGTYTPSKNF